jgi:DNA invertase Pin-like site-specific DNA recombinase
MKVCLYARCSTEEQSTAGVSLQTQIAKLTAYCALYDLEAIETIVDAGASAKSLDRDGLQKALAMLRSGQADGLVVLKLDRLTRSIADWQDLIEQFFSERAGRQLFSVCDSVDTRSAAGRMVLNILLTVAQWERETIGERTSQALQFKISRGERCGRLRFGYDLADDGKTLISNEAEQQAIGLMHELRGQGLTYRAIAAELGARNIPAKQAATWSHAAVRQILNRKQAA